MPPRTTRNSAQDDEPNEDEISFLAEPDPVPRRTTSSASSRAPRVNALAPAPSAYAMPGKDAVLLSFDDGNWASWSEEIWRKLGMLPGYLAYVDGRSVRPDDSLWPDAADTWDDNNVAVRALIYGWLSPAERQTANQSGTTTALALWQFLATRHEKTGSYAQVVLLRSILAERADLAAIVREDNPRSLAEQWLGLQAKVSKLFKIGEFSEVSLLTVATLGWLDHEEFKVAYNNINAALLTAKRLKEDVPPSALQNILEDANQHIVAKGKPAPTAFAAAAPASSARPKRHCTNCNRDSHDTSACWQPGGAMAGKRDEVLAARKKKSDGRGSALKPGQKVSIGSKAYIVTDDNRLLETLGAEFAGVAVCATSRADVPSPLQLSNDCLAATDLDTGALPDWIAVDDSADEAFAAIDGTHLAEQFAMTASHAPTFVFDSGATTHISPCRSDFNVCRDVAPRPITGIGGSHVSATAVGTIVLPVTGGNITLQDALHVPNTNIRLISVRALVKSTPGLRVTFDNRGVELSLGDTRRFFPSSPGDRLYSFFASPSQDTALLASRLPDLETIHRRLGHANFKVCWEVAKTMRSQGTPLNLSEAPCKCEPCVRGKQTRTPVPKIREGARAKENGELLFIDFWGPASTRSASGNLYSMSILCDKSSFNWAFPTKSKSDAHSVFRRLVRTLKASGTQVRRVNIDNAAELLGKEFTAVCDEEGITVTRTGPHTSEHNGRVERLHLTLANKSRAMRIAADVPENRWDEFWVTASYLTNITPTSSLPGGTTPHESFYGKPPSYAHLREIGCRAFALVHDHNPKIRPRSFECVLIGYGANSKTYRLYHRQSHKVISSSHVSFIESFEDPHIIRPPQNRSRDDDAPSCDAPTLGSEPREAPPTDCSRDDDAPTRVAPALGSEPRDAPPVQSTGTARPSSSRPQPARAIANERSLRARAITTTGPCGVHEDARLRKAVSDSAAASARVKDNRKARRAAKVRGRTTVSSLEDEIIDEVAFYFGDTSDWTDSDLACAATIQLDSEYDGDPRTLREALESAFGNKWDVAIRDELESLKTREVYTLVPRAEVPAGRKIMRGKFVFRLKRNALGEPERFKARWVCRGFEAVPGVDFSKTTSPTMRMESFRTIFHIAASLDWETFQIDVKTVYLYGKLPPGEECYMEQPPGYEDPSRPTDVCKLGRGIYGMPHSGRCWNHEMDRHLVSVGFVRCHSEYCIYVRRNDSGTVLFGVHVDDMAGAGSTRKAVEEFKADLRRAWEISDLGEATFVIGIAIERNRSDRSVSLSQTALIDKLLSTFRLADSFPASTPMDANAKLSRSQCPTTDSERAEMAAVPYRTLVGTLNYLAVGTRPDISYAVQQLAQYLDNPAPAHWEAAKRVARYLKGTRSHKLRLGGHGPLSLVGFSDSDWARCSDTRKSVSGYCFNLGSGVVSWSARKQSTVSDSSTEAEYIAASEASKEAYWLRQVLDHCGAPQVQPTPLLVDNSGAIVLSSDPSFHARTKHIEIKHHIIREYSNSGVIDVRYVNTKENSADIFTKPLPKPAFLLLRDRLGIVPPCDGGD